MQPVVRRLRGYAPSLFSPESEGVAREGFGGGMPRCPWKPLNKRPGRATDGLGEDASCLLAGLLNRTRAERSLGIAAQSFVLRFNYESQEFHRLESKGQMVGGENAGAARAAHRARLEGRGSRGDPGRSNRERSSPPFPPHWRQPGKCTENISVTFLKAYAQNNFSRWRHAVTRGLGGIG